MTQPATHRSVSSAQQTSERVVALKWLVVLAALSIATVLDGISVSNMSAPSASVSETAERAAITLPADRCEPGCTIMMASNQSPRL